MRKFVYLLVLIYLLVPSYLLAVTHTMSGCTQAAFISAYGDASEGDTVAFPATSCNITDWTSLVSIDKGITILGRNNGDGTSKITYNESIILAFETTSFFRVSGIWFEGGPDPTSFSGLIEVRDKPTQFRIDHNYFHDNGQGRVIHIGDRSTPTWGLKSRPYGLIDNNTFDETNGIALILVDFDHPDLVVSASWDESPTFGNANAVYIEDNTFIWDTFNSSVGIVDGGYGQRVVFRYNTLYNTKWGNHGAGDNAPGNDPRNVGGGHTFEIYHNTWHGTLNTQGYYGPFAIRGGSGLIYDNMMDISGSGSGVTSLGFFGLAVLRGMNADFCADTWGCTGSDPNSSVRDGHEGGGYPCYEQVGTVGPAANHVKKPVYQWNNQMTGYVNNIQYTGTQPPMGGQDLGDGCVATKLLLDRDYYDCASKAACQSGLDTNYSGYVSYTYPHPLQGIVSTSSSGVIMRGVRAQ